MKKLAFVFPGQGSQSLGMLSEHATRFPAIQACFEEASEVLQYDLWDLIQHDPHGQLNQTEFTQPALLTASVALWRGWCSDHDERPALLAGHSLGEYSAWVCAGTLSFTDALRIVSTRGRLMQAAVPMGSGGMAAIIGLSPAQVSTLCFEAAAEEIVQPANYNGLDQIVIAGHQSAVQRAMALAKSAGAKLVLPLAMSVPSHCTLMMPAAKKLAEALEGVTFHPPKIPVINNVDVKIENDPPKIKSALARQLFHPVQWVACMQALATQGVEIVIECGPGKVLMNLCKRTLPEMTVSTLGVLSQ